MKYAEGPTVEVAVVVDAPVDAVWALVSDIATAARFSSELVEAVWVDPPGPGARFRGRSRHAALGEWETVSYVVRRDPPHAFAWAVTDPGQPSASWWYELDPRPGGVHVRHGVRVGPGPSGLTPAITAMPDKEERIIARRLRELEANMTATLNGIKALAEASA